MVVSPLLEQVVVALTVAAVKVMPAALQKEVAVPVRLKIQRIGEALLLSARTRPKYIGGIRAKYE